MIALVGKKNYFLRMAGIHYKQKEIDSSFNIIEMQKLTFLILQG